MSEPSINTAYLDPVQLLEIDGCTRCGECVRWCPEYNVIKLGKYNPEEKTLNDKEKLNYTPKERIYRWRTFMNKSYGLRAKLFGPKKIDDEIQNILNLM